MKKYTFINRGMVEQKFKLNNSDLKISEAMKSPCVIWEEKEECEAAYRYATDLFYLDLEALCYGNLHVLPLTVEGEVERERLYNECDIAMYGAYESNFKFNDNVYLAILVNND